MIYQRNEYQEKNDPQLISNELEYCNGFFVKKNGNRTWTAEAERHVLGITNKTINYKVLHEDCAR